MPSSAIRLQNSNQVVILINIVNSNCNVFIGCVSQFITKLIKEEVFYTIFALQVAAEELTTWRVLQKLVYWKAPSAHSPLRNVFQWLLHVPEFSRVGYPRIRRIWRRQERIKFTVLLIKVCVALGDFGAFDVSSLEPSLQKVLFLVQIIKSDELFVFGDFLVEIRVRRGHLRLKLDCKFLTKVPG